jgi:hypothetical protein
MEGAQEEWPGGIRAGSLASNRRSVYDVYPTVAEGSSVTVGEFRLSGPVAREG